MLEVWRRGVFHGQTLESFIEDMEDQVVRGQSITESDNCYQHNQNPYQGQGAAFVCWKDGDVRIGFQEVESTAFRGTEVVTDGKGSSEILMGKKQKGFGKCNVYVGRKGVAQVDQIGRFHSLE